MSLVARDSEVLAPNVKFLVWRAICSINWLMAAQDPTQLLARFKANEPQLITELAGLAQRIAARVTLPSYLGPDDIAQEVLAAVYEHLRKGTFRGEAGIRTFVYRVAMNTCLTKSRETKLARLVPVEDAGLIDDLPLPDAGLLDADRRQLAARVVRSLPDRCRTLWRMIFWGRKSYRAAAKELDVKEVTVRERMSRCRKLAREMAAQMES